MDIMLQSMTKFNVTLDDGISPYSLDEQVALQQKALAIYAIMFEDKKYGFHNVRITEIHQNLTKLFLEKGDVDSALIYLQLAAEHAIKFDAHDKEGKYSSMLLRNYSYGDISRNVPHNEAFAVLEFIKNDVLKSINDRAELTPIMDKLERHAR
jgi:hypothetical protein